jgi:ubiquinone/menaquinone biosynthesis C-methylase UbiE
MKDEFSLEARMYDKTWGKYDYDADVRFLDDLLQEHDCKRVIDVGCGTANHATRLSKLEYEVTGVDISQTMLKIAKEKDKEAKIRFIQGDIRKLERVIPKSEKFDAAICLGQVFSNLVTNKDVWAFLEGLHKILAKNGLFVFNARDARRINEELLNRLLLDRLVTEEKLQLLLLVYNTRHPRNRNIIVWRPIYLMKENDRVNFEIKEHKLRWFEFSVLKRLLAENGFETAATFSGSSKEEFKEDEHATMWFVTIAR